MFLCDQLCVNPTILSINLIENFVVSGIVVKQSPLIHIVRQFSESGLKMYSTGFFLYKILILYSSSESGTAVKTLTSEEIPSEVLLTWKNCQRK